MSTFEERLKYTLSDAYEIERELGGGGMSRVFVATETSLGRKIVIKVLSPDLTADVNRGRFRREIQVAAQLQHPHIVTLLSAGEVDDLLFYTMPFISGESLKSALEKNKQLEVVEVVRILYHVAAALEYAHAEGVVHRDIKPANILRSGSYYLITDFGVAKALNAAMPSSGMTSTGMAVGTPAYMAPEQLAGDAAADHRIDIYAVGLLAYELLHGRSPFAATTPQRVLAAVLTQEPKPLIDVRHDVPPSLSELVMRCLSKDPADRPENAREVLDTLDLFSTASGEIRTMEHKLPRSQRITPTSMPRTTPTEMPVAPASEEEEAAIVTPQKRTPTPQEDLLALESSPPRPYVHDEGYVPAKKSRSRAPLIGVVLLIPIAIAAFFLSQGKSNGSSGAASLPTNADTLADSALIGSPLPTPAMPESTAVLAAAPLVDSQAIKDSLRRVRREAAAKKAAADSLKKAQATTTNGVTESSTVKARVAARGLLDDAAARKAFTDGATHKGGVLGTQRKGDLQTQIDALAPFLSRKGLSYEQFKSIVRESGVTLFDSYGRMLPNALQQFASGG